jgi:hypothetical protein
MVHLSRRLLPSFFRNSISSMSFQLCGERTLPMLSPSPPSTQHRVTQQILSRWQPFKDLKQTFAVSRRAEQLRERVQQRVVATVEDSALRTEMENLESDDEDASRRVLWYKPMSWLGQIRPQRRDEARSAGLWQASGRLSSPRVLVQQYRHWRSFLSRFVVAKSSPSTLSATTLAPVPLTREPKRLTTGRLIKLLTSFAQPTK